MSAAYPASFSSKTDVRGNKNVLIKELRIHLREENK